METKLTDIKVKARNTYGYQGGHGIAFTVTARCPDGKRRVCQYSYETAPAGKYRIYAAGLSVDVDASLFKAEYDSMPK